MENVTPDTSAINENNTMMQFFHKIHLYGPRSLPHRHTVSTMAGSERPMIDRHTAPTNSMKSSNLGIAQARPTVKKRIMFSKLNNYF